MPQVQPDVPQQPFAAAQWVSLHLRYFVMHSLQQHSHLQVDIAACLGYGPCIRFSLSISHSSFAGGRLLRQCFSRRSS